jgi:hypothetical protein
VTPAEYIQRMREMGLDRGCLEEDRHFRVTPVYSTQGKQPLGRGPSWKRTDAQTRRGQK